MLKPPILVTGMKIPLINIRGNFIKFDSIIIFDGLSVGGAEISKPREEKQNAANNVPIIRYKFTIFNPNKMIPINKIKPDIKIPNRKEAIMSPRIIAHKAMGAETNLSKVLIRVSQGAIIGEMAEEVKKSPIANKPGIKKLIDSCLPTAKAMNRKAGSSNPNTTTGPFK